MSDQTFTTESDPKDFNADVVAAYLATADESERSRVFGLETGPDGKDRETVKKAATATDDDETPAEQGLAATGNPHDLATKPDAEVSANIGHQEGAPEALAKVADESAAQGFFGESAAKPDYSQSNPEVMNGGGRD